VRQWSGPLPSPETIERYDQLVENGAERIFRQFELEAEERRASLRRGQDYAFRDQTNARICALAFGLAALGVAALAIYWEQPVAAATIGGVSLAMAIGYIMRIKREHSDDGGAQSTDVKPE
jgi:uncharacterized membrane protein